MSEHPQARKSDIGASWRRIAAGFFTELLFAAGVADAVTRQAWIATAVCAAFVVLGAIGLYEDWRISVTPLRRGKPTNR